MQNPYLKQIGKLHHPPSAPNWVRFVDGDESRTAKRILSWVTGRPPFTYRPGYIGSKEIIESGISLESAVKIATSSGAPIGWQANEDLVRAHHAHAIERRYRTQNPIGFAPEYFRVSRDLVVPVAPLSIVREEGKFVPIFLCGWKEVALSIHQRRLLMTIYEDAFLSLTDFQDSPSEFLFYPANPDGNRELEQWRRGDYLLLSKREVDDAVSVFVRGLQMAETELRRRARDWKRPNEEEENDRDQLLLI